MRTRPATWLVLAVTLPVIAASPHAARVAAQQNSTQAENAKIGTSDWRLTNPGYASGTIEGYASVTSVNRGGQIKLFVNTTDPSYTLEVFRIGYYQGFGGRRMTQPVTLPGIRQTIPPPDPTTGLIECSWTNPYVLDIPSSDPTDWMSGFYLVKLTGSSGKQQYIHFVVRDDTRASDLILAEAVTTAQAYNVWGGKSLYGTIANRGDTANAAHKVSFDRPYYGDETFGSGNFGPQNDFAVYEWGMVQFLEQNGYDVTYATNLDVDRDPNLLLNHKAFLSVGHDEYWSWAMRDNVEHARDIGVSLGFFSANTSYWQVRFENSVATGDPQRVMVGYKEACATDPITPTYLRTCRFRDARVNRSEDRMIGVMYITQGRMPFVVEDASHWIFTNTGLKNGDVLTNPDGSYFIGYEVDAMNRASPASTQRAAHSPATPNRANFADTVVYRAASGATVFSSGSILWTYRVPQIVQVTRNVLARLIGNAFADGDPIRPPLPQPFQSVDIGTTGRPGFVSLAGTDSFTLNGGGQDSFTGSDALYFVHQPFSGDLTITARVTGVQEYWNNRAGLMIRESLDPAARYVSLVSRPSGSRMNGTSGVNEGADFGVKSAAGARPTDVAGRDLPMPNWLKLSRTGDVFDAYVSSDGVTWTMVGSQTLALGSPVFVGASVASARLGVWTTASFDHVSVTPGGFPTPDPPPPPPPSTLPPNWSHQDIGAVGLAGSASYNSTSSTFSVTGAGADVWGTADAFQYAWTQLSGDGAIVARVGTMSAGASWIKAGVMMRGTLDAASAHGFMLVSYQKGVAFQRRVSAGGTSTSTTIAGISAPRWVRLARDGNLVTAAQSPDGVAWTVVASDTIAMPSTIYVGLAVSSHSTAVTATASFDNVRVTSGLPAETAPPSVQITSPAAGATVSGTITVSATAAADSGVTGVQFTLDGSNWGPQLTAAPYSAALDTTTLPNGSHAFGAVVRDAAGGSASAVPVTVTVSNVTPPPPPGLPSGWSHADVGAVGVAGAASYDGASSTFTVTGAGADVWGSADAFQYAYTRLSGDGRIVARVATVSAGAAWIKAGVMIRETLDASSAQGFMIVSYAKGVAFQRRAAAGGLSSSTSGGAFTAPRWVRLDRAGTTVSAYQSADGSAWTPVATDTIPMGTDVYAGLAVSSHTTTATATATFDNVAVTQSQDTTPPTVQITSPSSGATVSGTITVTASASDDVGVADVQFVVDGAAWAPAVTTAPYSVSLDTTTLTNGSHTLVASVRDTSRNSSLSPPVTVTVSNQAPPPAGTCPSVTLSRTFFYSGAPASDWAIAVTAPSATCTWTASIDQPWLLLNSVAGPRTISGTGSTTIHLGTLANTTGAMRYGVFTIAGTSYKVTQEY